MAIMKSTGREHFRHQHSWLTLDSVTSRSMLQGTATQPHCQSASFLESMLLHHFAFCAESGIVKARVTINLYSITNAIEFTVKIQLHFKDSMTCD